MQSEIIKKIGSTVFKLTERIIEPIVTKDIESKTIIKNSFSFIIFNLNFIEIFELST